MIIFLYGHSCTLRNTLELMFVMQAAMHPNETYRNLPSCAAAPPAMIFVMNILGSSPICGLSVPPAMLNPRPEFPCAREHFENQA